VPALGLELHAAFATWHERLTRFDAESVWERRRPFECFGTQAFEADPTDELIVLAVHAAKPFHAFDRLIWVADMVTLLKDDRRGQGFDWEEVARRSRAARCQTALAVMLRLAARAGADPPASMCILPPERWRLAALAPVLAESWPLTTPRPSDRQRIALALAETGLRRVQLLLGETKFVPVWRRPGHTLLRLLRGARGFVRLIRHSSAGRGGI
jgi:hypothetical protein